MTDKPIADLQSHNDLLQPLLDLLEDGVVVHDDNRIISLVNSATEKITGRAKDELIGVDCHTAFPPNGLCSSGCAFKDGPSCEAHAYRELSLPLIKKDGQQIYISVRSNPIVVDGKKSGVLALIRNVTEVNELKWQLNRKQNFHNMIGVSPKITHIFETIRAVGTSEYSVLITGESGTGKELAARAIHNESRRSAGPFVPVNCGALPENILESELFGHVRGAFTGAIRDKKGRFELANGGTLFLDEVGELPLHMQVKLLRVLQEKTFERVGGEKTITADIRLVAATNKDLKQMILDETFREDLYYRLCVVPIELPPLRERAEDIPYIVDNILQSIQEESNKEIHGVDNAAMKLLLSHPWPGNIRELINTLQFASIHCPDQTISTEHLPYEIKFGPTLESTPSRSRFHSSTPPPASPKPIRQSQPESYFEETTGDTDTAPSTLPGAQTTIASQPKQRATLTQEAINSALLQTGGNKAKAAKVLGVGRATLYRFLDKLDKNS